MYTQRHEIAITTDSSGDATAYTAGPINGRVVGVIYTKTDFADGVDFTISAEDSAKVILTLTNQNAAASFMPRLPVQDETGAAATLDGTRAMREPWFVANERIKVVVAAGGATKAGRISILVA